MTRSERGAHAVTALREARETANPCGPASMTFTVYEDNGGSYHWTIVAPDGATLARSEGFASYDDAEQAARIVQHGASSASFREKRPIDLPARSDAATRRDRLDAKRWLDEGGGLSSEAVARWPAER